MQYRMNLFAVLALILTLGPVSVVDAQEAPPSLTLNGSTTSITVASGTPVTVATEEGALLRYYPMADCAGAWGPVGTPPLEVSQVGPTVASYMAYWSSNADLISPCLTITWLAPDLGEPDPPPASTVSISEPASAQFLNMVEGQNLSFSAIATNNDPNNEMIASLHLMIGGALWESGPVTIPAGESGNVGLVAPIDFSIVSSCMNGEILVELGAWIGEVQVSEAAFTFPCSVGIDLPETTPVSIPHATITTEVCGANNDLWAFGDLPEGLQEPATPIWQNNSLTFVYEASPGFHLVGNSTQTLTDANTDCPTESPPPSTVTETPITDAGGGGNTSVPDTPGSVIGGGTNNETPTTGSGGGHSTIGGGQDNSIDSSSGGTIGGGQNNIISTGNSTIGGGGEGNLTGEYQHCDEGGSIGSHGGNYIPIINHTTSGDSSISIGYNTYLTNNTIRGNGSHSGGSITITGPSDGSGSISNHYINDCGHSIIVVDNTTISGNNNPIELVEGGGIYCNMQDPAGGILIIGIGSNVTIWAQEASQSGIGPYSTFTVTEPNFIDLRSLLPGLFRVVIEPIDGDPIELYVRVVPNESVTGLPVTGVGTGQLGVFMAVSALGVMLAAAGAIRVVDGQRQSAA